MYWLQKLTYGDIYCLNTNYSGLQIVPLFLIDTMEWEVKVTRQLMQQTNSVQRKHRPTQVNVAWATLIAANETVASTNNLAGVGVIK